MSTNENLIFDEISNLFPSEKEITKRMGIGRTLFSLWRRDGKVPAKHAQKLIELCGERKIEILNSRTIKLHDLNPEIFPVEK